MAVTLKGQTAVYEGVSTDTKPTDADNNAIFKELDTGIRYYYDGADWNEIPSSGGGGGGTGTDNYNELNNKPSINSTVLSGNKSLDNLGIQAKLTFDNAPTSGSSNPVKSGGVYSALESKQDTISDLSTIRSGAAAGATAVQPSELETVLTQKQDALSSQQLDAVNSGITSADVEQITTNKNNILLLEQANGAKNQINIPDGTYTAGTSSFSVTNGAVTSTATDNTTHAVDLSIWTLKAGTYVFYDDSSDLSAVQYRIYQQSPDTRLTPAGQNPATFTLANDTVVYLSCYTFKTGTMTTRPMLMTKAMWDAGFTDYQPYAPSNRELYEMILALQ